MRVRSSRPTSLLASVAATLLLGSMLAGCSPTAAPTATPKPTHSTPTPSASPTPDAPELIEGGTAQQNLPFFDQVNQDQIATGSVSGAAFVEALVAAGFPRESIEVTPDNTNVTAADSIMFSVRLGDSCLVGQFGSGVGYASTATDVLATGTCLIGTPRPAA
jgi:hypothetical protein